MLRYVLAALAAVCVPDAGQAVVFTTYVFSASGNVSRIPAPNDPGTAGDAKIVFSLANVSGLTALYADAYPGIGMVYSDLGGVNYRFDTSFLGISGGGRACFSNPGGTLPTSPVTLIGGMGCGGAQFVAQGKSSYVSFKGSITSFEVIQGDPYALAGGATAFTVPEPSTWAMMLIGLGAIGAAARSRRTKLRFAR